MALKSGSSTSKSTGDMQTSPAAEAVDLRKTYGRGQAVVSALDGVNVTFERGWFTAVMGPSGSGKSTLMHCMAGLDRPTSGRSFIGDLDIGTLDDAKLTELRRDRMGFVFQSFNLVPTLTAEENITLPADLAGTKVDKDWFDYLVEKLGLAARLSHRPGELSGGQQQRVACARALSINPIWSSPTSQRATSTRTRRPKCWPFSVGRSLSSRSQSSWSLMTRTVLPTPTGSFSWPTAKWWTSLTRPPPPRSFNACRLWGGTEIEVKNVSIKGLLAHKLRLALTSLAIVLGVTFIAGTFVLTDTLNKTFSSLFGNIYQKVDFQVRGVSQFPGERPTPSATGCRSPSSAPSGTSPA